MNWLSVTLERRTKTPSRGRPQRYFELAISTVLMLKRLFRLHCAPLRNESFQQRYRKDLWRQNVKLFNY
jgi:hypothetical protein